MGINIRKACDNLNGKYEEATSGVGEFLQSCTLRTTSFEKNQVEIRAINNNRPWIVLRDKQDSDKTEVVQLL